jgi:hypothetical protein
VMRFPDGPKRFPEVLHLWVMSGGGPLPTVEHMTGPPEPRSGTVMLPSDWTGQLARERMAELHRQAEQQRLVRLARAQRRGGISGVGRGRRWLARLGAGRHGVLDRAISSWTVGDAVSSS